MTETTALSTYIKEIEKIDLLTREEEYDLAVRAKQGDSAARDTLIKANSRFVVSIAKSYQKRGLPLEDLISEGNIGLITAIDKFEPDTGYHFISYAVWWIRQAILKAIGDKSRMIRLPMNKNAVFAQVQGVKTRLVENGDDVSVEDIAKECNLPAEDVKEILSYAREISSLDAPVTAGEGTTFGDFLESPNPGPEAELIEKSLTESIDSILNRLPERERNVIIMRYGLHNNEPMSLKEVGELYGVTKERIRQIEKKVLATLREDSTVKQLQTYIA